MLRETLKTLQEIWQHREGRVAMLSVAGMLAVGSAFYVVVEGWSWLDALYFTVITLTTVGYGDLSPTTPLSRAFTMVLILAGVGFILAFLNFVVTRTAERRRDNDAPGGDA